MPRQEGGRLLSDDGAWWWDGVRWQPVGAGLAPQPTGPASGPLVQRPRPGMATAALVLGVLGMFLWLLPIAGLPVTILAVVFGRLARFTPLALGRARWGFVLGLVGLACSLVNALVGAYLNVTRSG